MYTVLRICNSMLLPLWGVRNMDQNILKLKVTLLEEGNVFGDGKLQMIDKEGTIAFASDFARALGAETDEDGAGKWMLCSRAGYGDVGVVGPDGKKGVIYADGLCGIRPAAFLDEISDVELETFEDIYGQTVVRMGEYPQNETDRETMSILERECHAGSLRKTGKIYQGLYEEYEYDGGRYIRVEQGLWIEVSPVEWILDDGLRIMVSRRILLYGVTMGCGSFYEGDFAETGLCRYLNDSFIGELIPGKIKEETEEEKKARMRQMKEAEDRRNPYGFRFGHVTEEDIIRGAIESNVAVFLHGPSSEGKSARVKQIDPTCEIIYLRNATPDSLNGRSVYNQATGEMIDIPPTWFKKVKAKCEAEPDRLHVVFFDEINNALPSIQGMAFNIVLDREVNGLWKLPDNARVVAAGNDMQDSLAANQIAAPFFNRFAHVYINTTTDKWLKWARDNDIHPAIYAYIAYKDGETLRSRYDGERPNADPRKWEMASRMLYRTGQPEMLRALIGEDITEEFVRFCEQPVITLERVLDGEYSQREIDALDTSQRYATVMGLTQATEEEAEAVRGFVEKLGNEFVAIFDSIRTK